MSIYFSTAAQPMPPTPEPSAGAALPGTVSGSLPGLVPGDAPGGAAMLPLFAQFLGLAGLSGTSAEAAAADSALGETPESAALALSADAASSAQGESTLPAMSMPLPNMAPMPMAPVAMNNTVWPSGAAGLERGADDVAAAAGRLAVAALAPQSPADGAPGFDAFAAQALVAQKAGTDAAFAARTLSLPAQAAGGTLESTAGTPSSTVQAALPVQSASGDIARSAPSGAERGIATPAASGLNAAPAAAASPASDTIRQAPQASGDIERGIAAPPVWGMNAAPAAASPAADTIRLAGQAPQWQQALKEALGSRLSVQLERNMEHAVIRIDPPMLGRIEISVRHAAGALQVNLSASNGEVLQQLRSIGENMRNDLAQRHYTEVSVNITPTPRGSASPSFADGGDGARGRHPGRDEPEDGPGRALSEAGQAFSTFALSGQE